MLPLETEFAVVSLEEFKSLETVCGVEEPPHIPVEELSLRHLRLLNWRML
jgi:hypothetical protein